MTATGWSREFCRRVDRDKKLNSPTICKSESKYTRAMCLLLERMAKAHGYRVVSEKSVTGGGRADQRWLKGRKSAVIIEHENRSKPLEGEIEKLCNDVSKLKVLITYVPDSKFELEKERVLSEVKESINNHIGTFMGELILVVGGWGDENDWAVYRSRLTADMKRVAL